MQLKIINLCKKINNYQILKNISFTINSGEITIFIGISGAGKSTILRILNNLEFADSGEILLNGKTINLYNDNQIGMIFQNFNLFSNLSVLENITLGLIKVKKKTKEEANSIGKELLKKYNLINKINDHISSLSGGQKQKLAIIRTLVMEPKIICFDEPFSALDPYSTQEIINLIQELQKQNYIIIITTHNVYILNQLNSNIYLINNGQIIESTQSELFFNNSDKYINITNFIKAKKI
jgi:ABC-type polar amino acid transport system ATPase subunit